MIGRRLEALWILAWSLLAVLLGRLARREPGARRFREQFLPDRLEPLACEDRALLVASSSCIACGRCAAAVAPRPGLPAAGSPPEILLAGGRSMPEYDATSAALSTLTATELRDCGARCPTGVSFVGLAAVLRRKATRLAPAPGSGSGSVTDSG